MLPDHTAGITEILRQNVRNTALEITELKRGVAQVPQVKYGNIIAIAVDKTITVAFSALDVNGVATTTSVAGIKCSYTPHVGATATVLDSGHGRMIAIGDTGAPSFEPMFYIDAFDNGAATGPTSFADHSNILTAPCPLIMVVDVWGEWGFTASNNASFLRVYDEGSVGITGGGNDYLINHNTAGQWQTLAISGKKAYTAGQACGFKLAYWVDTSNLYVRAFSTVRFYPRH